MTSTGAAYMAGLAVGFWKDTDELLNLRKDYQIFKPKMDPEKRKKKLSDWKKAVKAVLSLDK